DPHSARAAHSGALGLREAIYACLAAPLARAPPPAWAASDLQRFAAHAIEHGRLVPAPDAPRFMLEWTEPSLDRMLWPIAHSAHTLATSDEIRRVKQCPGQDGRCGWLFLDGTKNNTRRWCDMRVCGNPVKTRRQSERRRKARARRA